MSRCRKLVEKAEVWHWLSLHDAARQMRSKVGKALTDLQAIESDAQLSAEGKMDKKRDVATKAQRAGDRHQPRQGAQGGERAAEEMGR